MPKRRPIPAPVTRPAPLIAPIRGGTDPGLWRRSAPGSALEWAPDQEYLARVRVSVGFGVNPNGGNFVGNAPLHDAAEKDNAFLTRLLLAAGADPNLKNNLGDTALCRAAQFGKPAVVRLLLDAGADPEAVGFEGCTALHRAVQNSKVETVELLLQHHADVDIRNIDGRAALDNVRPKDTRIRELLGAAAARTQRPPS